MPILNWKQDRVLIVPKNTPKIKDGKKSTIQNKEMVKLLPGYNEISEKDWLLMEKNCKYRLEDGNLEILTAKEGDKEKQISFADLAKSDPEKAREVIASTYHISLLEQWQKSTGRDELRAAISNQISSVKNYSGSVKQRKVGIH